MAWRYFVQRRGGPLDGQIIEPDLPLSDAELTTPLSGPWALSGVVSPALSRLKGEDGRPILEEWGCAIWAEADGEIRGGGLLVDIGASGPNLSIECMGLAGYPHDMPWTAEPYFGVQVDPLDVVRLIWSHLQSQPGGNLALEVSDLKTPVLIGEELELVEFTTGLGEAVSFEAGPVKLNSWQTHDLGKEIDDLAVETPFDYLEKHWWDGEQLRHRLDFGYPALGNRRHDLRFVLGENVTIKPDFDSAEVYANEWLYLGAGEGRDMIQAHIAEPDDRVRRVGVTSDKSVRSKRRATELARALLSQSRGERTVEEIEVIDHPNAPIGSWQPGDEILLQAEVDWEKVEGWFRVLSTTLRPQAGAVTLSIVRAGQGA